jgi:hypothetical protein
MTKVTKLIIATIALGGLGYFLYKKGMFAKSVEVNANEISKAKKEKELADAIKENLGFARRPNRGGLEPELLEVFKKVPIYDPNTNSLVYDTVIGTPIQVPVVNPVYNDSYYEAIVYPTVNDTYGGLRIFGENDPSLRMDYDSNAFGSGSMDYKLGIDENYKYK